MISQKLPLNGFESRIEKYAFDEEFFKSYDKDSKKDHILETYVKYSKDLHKLHSNFYECKKPISDIFQRNIIRII